MRVRCEVNSGLGAAGDEVTVRKDDPRVVRALERGWVTQLDAEPDPEPEPTEDADDGDEQ